MLSVPSLSCRTVLLDQLNSAVFVEIGEGMTILQVLGLKPDRLRALTHELTALYLYPL